MVIKELYKKVKTKEHLQNKLNSLYAQKDEYVSKVDSLEKSMKKEQKDVDSLEKGNLTAFFLELCGKKEQKLDKERAEAYEAKVKYDNAAYQLAEINNEIDKCEKQIDQLQDCEKQYKTTLKNRQTEMRNTNPEILQLEETIISSKLLQKEITEAIQAGMLARETANQVLSILNDADSWAIYDIVGGGLIADMAKYDALDKAEQLIQNLQAQLNSFKTELTDIKIQTDIQVSIDNMLRTADYFFDNIFTDYTVKSRIEAATDQVKTAILQIDEPLSYLNSLIHDEKEREHKAISAIEQIILHSS